jgi:hypothetical protein
LGTVTVHHLPRFTLLLLAAFGSAVACQSRTPEPSAASSNAAEPPAPAASARAPAVQAFGAPIGPGPTLSLAGVLATPERFRDQAITVQGQVRSACTRRGCWMEVAESTDPKLSGCRVTFKDYGFFVPTDSTGSTAKVQGVLGVNTLPPERVAHLESEGGQFPHKNADGSVNELRLVATGVELWR